MCGWAAYHANVVMKYLYLDQHFLLGGMEMVLVLVVIYLLGFGLVHWGDSKVIPPFVF